MNNFIELKSTLASFYGTSDVLRVSSFDKEA